MLYLYIASIWHVVEGFPGDLVTFVLGMIICMFTEAKVTDKIARILDLDEFSSFWCNFTGISKGKFLQKRYTKVCSKFGIVDSWWSSFADFDLPTTK